MHQCVQESQLVLEACNRFEARFKQKPEVFSSAPGRVNLIGEHVDYNDGFVMPMAIPMFTVIVGAKSESKNFEIETICEQINDNVVRFDAEDIKPGDPSWANYVKGVIANFPGPVIPFNAVITTSIPMGCGLSSSAALEVSVFSFLEGLSRMDSRISLKEKALICQRAEHVFANVPCGLMDQLIAFMGEEHNALLIDCRSLETELIPCSDQSVAFVVCNSNVRHSLASSEYANRRKTCEQVAALLGKGSLRDVEMRELETSRNVLTEEMYQNARHVITEICRTQSAAEALKNKDYKVFGTLMTQSHISLRDDYRVSCSEVDELVEAALECSAVYGSRMTGGGFGGCTVSLVQRDKVNEVINHIKSKCQMCGPIFVFDATKGSRFEYLSNQ